MRIAIVADIHLHDLFGGYGSVEALGGRLALRTLDDTMASTRIFNESRAALLSVLEDIAQRGITDVVLLGDYSDDGQPGSVAALKPILTDYQQRYGFRFFTTFGNHDLFGPEPRHQAKILTGDNGLHPILVTSDGNHPAPCIVSDQMRGMSTFEAMEAMTPYGITRPDNVFHWERPFGQEASPAEQLAKGADPSQLDGSYLVEPQPGLWLLMLDANVFHQVGGRWQVRDDGAWDHVLAARPYLMDWISDVAQRAKALGKALLAFSHYPALPLAFTEDGRGYEVACTPDWARRMPGFDSAARMAKAGIRWHFSGHMHVASRVKLGGLENIAVPSPCAFPGGYCVAEVAGESVTIEHIQPEGAAGFDVAFAAYHAQASKTHQPMSAAIEAALSAKTYPQFLRAHLHTLIDNRHLPADWSKEFRADLSKSVAEIYHDDPLISDLLTQSPAIAAMPLMTMIEDYYFLRSSASTTMAELSPERADFYRALKAKFAGASGRSAPNEQRAIFLRLLAACIMPQGPV